MPRARERFSPPSDCRPRAAGEVADVWLKRTLKRRSPESDEFLRGVVTDLTFLWRPTIGFGARAAHQHRSLTVAQAVSLEEGLDGLLVVDDARMRVSSPCPTGSGQN